MKFTPYYTSLYLFIQIFLISKSVFSQPVINSFSPVSAPIGSVVNISGTNFNASISANTVFFGAEKASIISASTNLIRAVVPKGAIHGRITIINNGLYGYSSKSFTVISGTTLEPDTYNNEFEFPTGTYPTLLARGDLNEDQLSDIAVTNFTSDNIYVYVNKSGPGTADFKPPIILNTGPNPEKVLIEDINGDSKPDIIVSNIAPFISIFLNNSTNGIVTFLQRIDIPVNTFNSAARGIFITDVNLDGRPDIITADNNKIIDFSNNTSFGTISILKNISSAGNLAFDEALHFKAGEYPRDVYAADLDGDNKPDIVSCNHIGESLDVYLNESTLNSINMDSPKNYLLTAKGERVSIADIDGDGKNDLISTATFGITNISIFKNTSTSGNISFDMPVRLSLEFCFGFSVGDMNGDGKPDIAVSDGRSNTTRITVLINTSTPGKILLNNRIEYYGSNEHPVDALIGDVDGDDFPDLTFTNPVSKLITVLLSKYVPSPPPDLNLGNDTSICEGDSIILSSPFANAQFFWNTGETNNKIIVKESGIYWLKAITTGGIAIDSITINVTKYPIVDLGKDETLCKGKSKVLNAFNEEATYKWNNNNTTATITIAKEGIYSVEVNRKGCIKKDTITLSLDSIPVFSLGPDVILCKGQQTTLNTGINNGNIVWNNGAISPSLVVSQQGNYSVTVSNTCGSLTDHISITQSNCTAYFPNSFTPNNDKINDYYKPIITGLIKNYSFRIINRFGETVFYTSEINKSWNGKINGIDAPPGLFIWQCTYEIIGQDIKKEKGTVLLIR